MSEEITLEEYKQAFFEVYKEQRRKGFFLHLKLYISVNTISIIINYLFTPTLIWVIFPIFFWGIGVIWGYLGAIRWIDQRLYETSLKAEYRLKKETPNYKS